MMHYSSCLSPHGVDVGLIPKNLPSRVWGSNDCFHFNTNGNCNNTNVHQVTFLRYRDNTRMHHTNHQLPPRIHAAATNMYNSCSPANLMSPQQHLTMTAIRQPPPPWPFIPVPMQEPVFSRIVPFPFPCLPSTPLRAEQPATSCHYAATSPTVLHVPQWESCLQPITSSIVYSKPRSQDKELPSPVLSKQVDTKLTKIPPLIDMSGIIKASTVDDSTLGLSVSPKPLCIVMEGNDACYNELAKCSSECNSNSLCSIAGSNSDNNMHVSSLIDANLSAETPDINNMPAGTDADPVSNYRLPFADFLDNTVSPLQYSERLCDDNDPVPMDISHSDDEFVDVDCPLSPDSIDTEREPLWSPLVVVDSQSDNLDSPIPPSLNQVHCYNSQSPEEVETQSPLVVVSQSDDNVHSPTPSPDLTQCYSQSPEEVESPLVIVSQSDDDLYSPIPSPNLVDSPSSPDYHSQSPLVVSIPLNILPQLQDPSPLVVSLPIKFWENTKQKTKISNRHTDDEIALQTLEKIFESSTLLSVEDKNLIRQFMKGEDVECVHSHNILRFALSKVLNTTGDLEYATVELDLVQKQWRGVMINAKGAVSVIFHNHNQITS